MTGLTDTFCTFRCRPHQADGAPLSDAAVQGARVDRLEGENSSLRAEVLQLQVSKRETNALLLKQLLAYRSNAEVVVCKLITDNSALKADLHFQQQLQESFSTFIPSALLSDGLPHL